MHQHPIVASCRWLSLVTLLAAWVAPGMAEPLRENAAEPQAPDLATRKFGHDWPTFLGPHGDGKSKETGLDFDWPDAGPSIAWQAPLGVGYGGPSISRGRLFHFDRHGDHDRLTCRVAETGELLWSAAYPTGYADLLEYNNGPRCSPVVDGDRVYTFSSEGFLRCARVTDGDLMWQIDTAKQFNVVKNFFGVGSTPLVFGDYLIVNVGGGPPGGPSDVYAARGEERASGSGVVAFDKLRGTVAWKCADELASYASPVAAEIDGRPWCFVFARGGLVALNPLTGQIDFQYPWRAQMLESVNASSPVVVGDEVFISETYGPGSSLLRVRPGAFDVVWKDDPRTRRKSMQLHWNTAIQHDGYLYGSSGRHSNGAELRCIEWSTGNVRWNAGLLGRCSLLYADGHLINLSELGTLQVLKANPERYELMQSVLLQDADGEELLKPPAWTAPVLARGMLYVRGEDRLVCIDLAKQRAQSP
ncbi:Outer membrane protein assembly factor BamB [Pirellulimonas nuda]|uniref:Outer membrane protein assembly factor BamB n=1 Tax=Pirellulimonas nuda TaxID=2528009 RepID=A0A518DDU3_9BACT|nr:PQQ-binding-like beta-propeller repeat protein [Pirellulimonas nuda]QDU89643.1 Outer membrane protein assembly factor BamB [Pirellulimonas nuda]